jgi:hypothetical protein
MAPERKPWEGEQKCGSCGKQEIDGLGFCIHHVPDEDLPEAEGITGLVRCRQCSYLAVEHTNPPTCPEHSTPQTRRASTGFIESTMADRMAQILSEHGDYLMNPPPGGNPLDGLLDLRDEVTAFKEILRIKVSTMPMDVWRYANDRVGEQIRTELYLYERAIDRLAKLLINIAKLHIAEHRLELERETLELLLTKLALALEDSGADLVGQARAKERLAAELEPYLK